MEYNDLGQLRRKALHGQIGAGIQDLNYVYNIRGWLERINDPSTNPTSASTKKFNLGLYYNTTQSGLTSNPQYNGNISAIVWNTPARTEALSPAYKQGYGFTYDALNRLTSSVYGESTDFATSAGVNNESYTYDLNGNIKSLARYRKGTGLIDNLTYTYKNSNISNLLDKVEDASGTNGFNNGVNTTNEYSFDGSGNLTADLNKGYTSILYNYLNLPKRVGTATAGQYISYIYDAAGTKLAKVSTTGAYTYYAGNFVYSGSSLSYIIHQEGHVEPGGAYKYYIKDHLGSVRMVVNTSGTGGTIEQQTDYYPFGMTIAEYNGSIIDYRYNGKELQDDLINGKKLDWYDYGARFYDAQIGRFHTQDAFAEKYLNLTPYQYAANNPIRYIDVNGDSVWVNGYYYGYTKDYGYGFYDKSGSLYLGGNDKFLNAVNSALAEMSLGKEGASLVNELAGSNNHFYITDAINNPKKVGANSFIASSNRNSYANIPELQAVIGDYSGSNGSGGTIYFNPSSKTSGFNTARNTDRPSFIGLAHELLHGRDANRGTLYYDNDYTNLLTGAKYKASFKRLEKNEWRATYYENVIRSQAHIPLRTSYGIQETAPGVFAPSAPRLIDSKGNLINYLVR